MGMVGWMPFNWSAESPLEFCFGTGKSAHRPLVLIGVSRVDVELVLNSTVVNEGSRVIAVPHAGGGHFKPVKFRGLPPRCNPVWTFMAKPIGEPGPELAVQPLTWAGQLTGELD